MRSHRGEPRATGLHLHQVRERRGPGPRLIGIPTRTGATGPGRRIHRGAPIRHRYGTPADRCGRAAQGGRWQKARCVGMRMGRARPRLDRGGPRG